MFSNGLVAVLVFFFLYLPTFLKHTLKVSKLLSRMHEEWCSLPMVPKALKKSQTLKAIGLVWCPVVVGQRKTILVWMVFIRCLSRTAVHCFQGGDTLLLPSDAKKRSYKQFYWSCNHPTNWFFSLLLFCHELWQDGLLCGFFS